MASGFPAPQLAVIPSNGIITNPSLTQSNIVIPLNYKNPYVESWNFSVQRSLPLHFTLDVAYVGNHGVRTSATYNLNVPTTADQMGIGVNGRPEYQQFKRTADTTQYFTGYSSMYNGLQVKLNRRFTNGLAITTAYTLARGMSFQTGDDGGIWNYINPRRSYARTDFDRHQTFVQSYVYDLPFGVGKKWLNHGLAAKTIGGWQINGILTLMTGTPMTFGASGSSLNTPGSTQTADQVAPVTMLYGINTPSKGGSPWFSQASFVQPTGVRFGSSGRNTFSGPGFFNADLSIFKIFNFTEKIKMEIRGESFSVTNTPQFNNPNTNVQDSNYGYVTGAGGGRGMQLGVEDQLLADRVPQYSHVVEFHLDHIAGRHPSGVARRSCIDQVSRQQSHPPADPAQYRRDIENQIAGVLLLHRLPIDPRLEQELAVIDSADDGGTERRERIRALGAPPLQILLLAVLPGAFADIVAAGDAEDGGAGLRRGRVAQVLADYHHHLAFRMHVGGVARDDDGVCRILQRGHRLVEHLRVRGLRARAQMALVIQTHGQDLARLAGVQQLHVGELVGGAGGGVAVEQAPLDLVDGVAFQGAVGDAGSGLVADVFGHVSDIVTLRLDQAQSRACPNCAQRVSPGGRFPVPLPSASRRPSSTAAVRSAWWPPT